MVRLEGQRTVGSKLWLDEGSPCVLVRMSLSRITAGLHLQRVWHFLFSVTCLRLFGRCHISLVAREEPVLYMIP